ncbi:hypothetical protein AVEN_144429-1, partial [Araneus ventricosus]
ENSRRSRDNREKTLDSRIPGEHEVQVTGNIALHRLATINRQLPIETATESISSTPVSLLARTAYETKTFTSRRSAQRRSQYTLTLTT